MQILGEEIVFNGQFIAVKNIYFKGSDGETHIWEAVERKTKGKIVSIFSLTDENEVILIKNFRIPFGKYVIEFPAGLMDKPGEGPEDAIKRELMEETGYTFEGKPELLIEGPFNPGLLTDVIMVFCATGVYKVSEPDLEPVEEIKVIKVPVDSFVDFVLNPPDDCCADVKLLNVVPILQRKGILKSHQV